MLNNISEDAVLAVKNGIYWLDENHPDWAYKIDINQLDMSGCRDCIIGQAVGDYTDIITDAGNGDALGNDWSVEHGFERPSVLAYSHPDHPITYGYKELDTLWSEEVQKRLG
jgi:hypothetical protein